MNELNYDQRHFLGHVKEESHSLYALLFATKVKIDDNVMFIYCRFSFHYDRLVEPKNAKIIKQAAALAFKPGLIIIPLKAI